MLYIEKCFFFNLTWVRYNLKQRKLPVIEKFHINGGFLFKEAIGSNSWECIGYEIIEWPMSWMFYLGNILQFIVNRFNYRSLSDKNLVVYIHQHVLHVVLDFSDQLNAVHKQSIEQGLAYISLVCTQLSFDVVQEWTLLQRLPVIHISWCKHEVQYFSFVIDNQV